MLMEGSPHQHHRHVRSPSFKSSSSSSSSFCVMIVTSPIHSSILLPLSTLPLHLSSFLLNHLPSHLHTYLPTLTMYVPHLIGIVPDTWTSPSRWSAPSGYSMEPSQCSMELPAWSLKLRQCGAKQINTRYVRTLLYHIICHTLTDLFTHRRTYTILLCITFTVILGLSYSLIDAHCISYYCVSHLPSYLN